MENISVMWAMSKNQHRNDNILFSSRGALEVDEAKICGSLFVQFVIKSIELPEWGSPLSTVCTVRYCFD